MAGATIFDYQAVLEPDETFFKDAFNLADRVGGVLGIAPGGKLVITLYGGDQTAQEASNSDAVTEFPHCYVVPGTDSVLVFDL